MYEIIAFLSGAVVGFVVGFFVGKKHGIRVVQAGIDLKDKF